MINCSTPEKEFCCLKMKQELQKIVYAKTKDMDFLELRAYLDENLENNALWHKIRQS
ncbi:MAG: hypothetical protein FWG85_04160 [Bacteroidetes bacterium]|nr:hypothetical protein [Bacteroidota bacterium]